MNIALIDNYDSFTYNLVHYFEALGHQVDVRCNDQIDHEKLQKCDAIVLSPGPGLPQESGQLMEVISSYYHTKPILGICLGMQALAIYDGMELYNMKEVWHGISKEIDVDTSSKMFRFISAKQDVGLYHSWAIKSVGLSWRITAQTEKGVPMAIEHSTLPIAAVQFHPESVMTPNGIKMLENWTNSIIVDQPSILADAAHK